MRWRNGETVGVEKSMILLQSVNEADCLDQQHRRTGGTADRHHSCRSAYRASGLVPRLVFGLLLLAALACFGAGLFKRDPRWHRLGAVILKWTLIAALGFFAVLIVQRLLGH